MDIGFFINYDNQVVQLPVNPESVSVSYSGNNSTTEIIKLGEINLLKDRKLAEIQFESFFPEEEWFPAIRTRGEFKKPQFYKDFFTGIQAARKPCRLVITGIDISMKCSVEQFKFTHQSGDYEDAYYSLSFKEYRDHQITQVAILSSNSSSNSSSSSSNTQVATPGKAVAPTNITIGCSVILNGRVHYNSYGAKPGKTFKNYKGKINFINTKGSHPYHVTTPSGGWLGWVTKESVVLA